MIQSLEHTIGAKQTLLDQFEAFRKKRNLGNYERAGAISDQEAKATMELAQQLRRSVEAWVRANHRKLP